MARAAAAVSSKWATGGYGTSSPRDFPHSSWHDPCRVPEPLPDNVTCRTALPSPEPTAADATSCESDNSITVRQEYAGGMTGLRQFLFMRPAVSASASSAPSPTVSAAPRIRRDAREQPSGHPQRSFSPTRRPWPPLSLSPSKAGRSRPLPSLAPDRADSGRASCRAAARAPSAPRHAVSRAALSYDDVALLTWGSPVLAGLLDRIAPKRSVP